VGAPLEPPALDHDPIKLRRIMAQLFVLSMIASDT
jgi:hypothetical protein